MTEQDWKFPDSRFLAYVLGPVERTDPALFIVLNAAVEPVTATFPKLAEYRQWLSVIDTTNERRMSERHAAGASLQVPPRAVLVFASEP
jgi:glycogen operon protein